MVCFGGEPARVDDGLIELLRTHEAIVQTEPARLFRQGQSVRLTETPSAGIEGIYQMADGVLRAMVLIEILSKPVVLRSASQFAQSELTNPLRYASLAKSLSQSHLGVAKLIFKIALSKH